MACQTGKEKKTKELCELLISKTSLQDCTFLFPTKEINERKGGVFRLVSKPILPGYLFIRYDGESEDSFPFSEFRKLGVFIHFLTYSNNTHALIGNDERFALWIDKHDAVITRSKVLFTPGQKIKIIEGPLVGFEGNVVKIDKHHKRITLRFDLSGIASDISFSVEFLEQNAAVTAISQN